jgi:hypothetical protein
MRDKEKLNSKNTGTVSDDHKATKNHGLIIDEIKNQPQQQQ